jgi:hypothetical protein
VSFAISDAKDILRAPFAVGRRPEQHGAIMILQRPGDDLGGARRVAVDEHCDRKVRPRLRRVVVERLRRVGSPTAHADDALTRIQEQIGNANSLIE